MLGVGALGQYALGQFPSVSPKPPAVIGSGGGGGGGGGGRTWPVRGPITRWGPWRPDWLDRGLGEVRAAFSSTEQRDGIRLRGELSRPATASEAVVSVTLKAVEGSDTVKARVEVTLNATKYDNDFLMMFSGDDEDDNG